MKKLITVIGVALLATFSVQAQSSTYTNANGDVYVLATPVNTNTFAVSSGLSAIWQDVKGATNYALAGYLTYAPKAPTKIGGGAFLAYNLNKYVAPGLGVDWLGGFSMVSGQLELKLPLKPFEFIGWTNVNVEPFVIGGIGTPVSGYGNGSSSVSFIEDVGIETTFGHLWGGQFLVAAAYGKWTGTGPYDVPRYHFALGWSRSFF
jgi:hypothetical protein